MHKTLHRDFLGFNKNLIAHFFWLFLNKNYP